MLVRFPVCLVRLVTLFKGDCFFFFEIAGCLSRRWTQAGVVPQECGCEWFRFVHADWNLHVEKLLP